MVKTEKMERNPIIKKAIIPIAGYGTRLFPATKAVPKVLFPIIAQDGIAKPIIQLIIEEALTAGVEEVCLVAQPQQVELLPIFPVTLRMQFAKNRN